MSSIKTFVFSFLILVYILPCSAQRNNSIKADSISINEAVLLREQQQTRIDSLVKIQLQQELANVTGNAQKTKELEDQLKEIARTDSLRHIAQLQKIRALKKDAVGYPVVLNNDTLFNIYTRTGSFNARDRARAISNKVEKLYKDPFYRQDSLVIAENEDSYDLIYNNTEVIVSIGNLDGLWFDKENAQLAQEYLNIIKQHISKQRDAHSLTNLIKRIGWASLIILLLVIIVSVINRAFKSIARFLSKNKEKYLHILKLRKIKIITADHLETALLKLSAVVKILLILLIISLSLPWLFSIFPETEDLTGTLLNMVLDPLRAAGIATVNYLPDLFKIIVICLIFRYLLKGIKYIFQEIKRGNLQFRGFHAEWAIPTFNVLKILLYAFMLILIFPFLPGASSPAFQGVSVFLGILISLGSSSAIGNIVAGLVITYMRPFRVGDRVKIGEVVGDVMEKSMLVTRIKTIKNEDITVPNSMVLSSSTVNYSSNTKNQKQGLIIHYIVTLGYDVPWQKVYGLLIEAALKTEHIQAEPKPFVLQTSLDDFFVSYQINAYTLEANKQALIYSKLLENIQDVLGAAGIEIMSPSYHVVKDGGKEK